jgi:hypothetical protein
MQIGEPVFRFPVFLVMKLCAQFDASQNIHSQHPPDEKDRDDAADDMNNPVANGFGFSKIKHAEMLAVTSRAY